MTTATISKGVTWYTVVNETKYTFVLIDRVEDKWNVSVTVNECANSQRMITRSSADVARAIELAIEKNQLL